MNTFDHAIQSLEITLSTVENNAPINRAEGKIEQADLEDEVANSCRAAIRMLKGIQSAPVTGRGPGFGITE